MGILTLMKMLFLGMLSNILPFLSYKGVVNTQIALYKKMRSREPEIPEDDLLNVLLFSRIDSLPRITSKEQEYKHYESLLRCSEKTLKDVIWAIIEYEYILSREEHLLGQAVRTGSSQEELLANVDTFEANVKRYIEKRIGAMGNRAKEETEEARAKNEAKNKDDARAYFALAINHLTDGDIDSALREYQIVKELDEVLASKLYDQIFN